MDTQKYNGWANYPTWRVNLEFFDGLDWDDTFQHVVDDDKEDAIDEIKDTLESMMDEYIASEMQNKWIMGWVDAWLAQVNYYEIAKHIYDEVMLEHRVDECLTIDE